MTGFIQITEPELKQEDEHESPAIGIDLGTTNSVVAIVAEDGKARVLASMEGDHLIPSFVSYTNEGIHVGHAALRDLKPFPKNLIKSVKRFMPEAGVKTFSLQAKTYTPVEISAEILKKLKKQAENSLKVPVQKAVITVPAYFDDAARMATKAAAQLAGLDVLRMINEPTAAALAYGIERGVEGFYAVYDLGGGTFDFSVLKLEKGLFKVIATGGDNKLGGDDFDDLFLSSLRKENPSLNKILNQDPLLITEVLLNVQSIKEELSLVVEVTKEIIINSEKFFISMTREDYEGLIKDKIQKTLSVIQSVLRDAHVKHEEIKGVVLVGGATRTPIIRESLKNFFQKEPLTNINPDEVVALGAAYQAYALTHGSETLLLDVIPLSLGLETFAGVFEKILSRNSPIPISKTQEFTTYQDGQTALLIHVLQGERELAKDCLSLARFEFKGIPILPAGVPRIIVTFSVDADGLLTVSATEKTTGLVQEIDVYPTYGLSSEKIKKMLLESLLCEEEDIKARFLAESQFLHTS